jgi:hypothetical protein
LLLHAVWHDKIQLRPPRKPNPKPQARLKYVSLHVTLCNLRLIIDLNDRQLVSRPMLIFNPRFKFESSWRKNEAALAYERALKRASRFFLGIFPSGCPRVIGGRI